jgi:cbb3-type cytochrome oxidase maturation protein
MTALAWLVPVALLLGALGLAAFMWSLKSGQFEDLDGAGWRALDDESDAAKPAPPAHRRE